MTFLACSGCGGPPGTIGAALGQDRADHRLFVRAAPAGQGADEAGLVPGDEIVALEGRDVRVLTEDEVRSFVRGPVGSRLVVTVRRGEERRDVVIVRTPLR